MQSLRWLNIAICLLVIGSAHSEEIDYRKYNYILMDRECKIMRHALGEEKIETAIALNAVALCKRASDKVECEHIWSDKEINVQPYNILADVKGLLLLVTPSRNGTIFINLQTNKFSIGITMLNMDQGTMLNKQCAGIVVTGHEFQRLYDEEIKK